ncbi:MAG: gluconate 2-dehydrogenase subunit 3 family protein [Acidobacteriota bacterium]
MRSDNLRRRKFLQIAAAGASAAAVSCGGRAGAWNVLTDAEAETLNAMADRIIPPDQDPGAGAAGAARYVDRQLGGPFRKYRRVYREGLAGVDRASQERFGKRFAALAADQQDAVLAALDGAKPGPMKAFFDTVRDHTMQSYYGDPRHGGNRDFASWQMLNIPAVPVRGRNLYDLSGEGLASWPRRTKWRSNA